jgi:FKBP-type peptidyl-prolyl cis-trans isomerase
MKKIFVVAALSFVATYASAQTKAKTTAKKPATTKKAAYTAKPVAKPALKNLLDTASYAFGQMMASNLKQGGLTAVNYDLFTAGLRDAFGGKTPVLPQQISQESINKLFQSLSKKKEEMDKVKFAPVIKEGADLLAKNKSNPKIKTTASGLQYEVITEGTGLKPKDTSNVTVHYKGTLINGKQFDSSYDRNEPATFGLNQVIKGWTEGVQLMPEGSKYRFYIPYDLAYGPRGAGQDIPPYSTLIFEIELLKVNAAKK